ncbi:MAG: methylenetetrahydrofolate--tRNA-(uracil(54)-C(5))-methyltransferase (FADH(2)-oxidizing) TrmFO, partial [Slackia sp.]|nr:methylenetetrahydrofolate--tRNA-(uracil(54)-C(5))-methyltransferase (FADH(2)-oxidizing) TrmFO [Slackia sp.]
LLAAERVIKKEFETSDLFQACQPIEEIARKGRDAPRFGTCKPVGLTDPATGRRPWAAVQLRAENADLTAYNLVGFQTNLTFPEQRRVFRMIPGLEHAEFARYGVMHRNTFICAPELLDEGLRFAKASDDVPVYVAGQLSGTEGYCEAIMSGLVAALSVFADLEGIELPSMPRSMAFGALLAYATDPETQGYQPMHVNFGIMEPFEERIRNKQQRYAAYARRGSEALESYKAALREAGIV